MNKKKNGTKCKDSNEHTISICLCFMILTQLLSHRQVATQGQFLSRVQLRGRRNRFMLFPRALVSSETQPHIRFEVRLQSPFSMMSGLWD